MYIYCKVIVRPQSALRVQATMVVPGWWPAHYAAAPLLDGLTAPYEPRKWREFKCILFDAAVEINAATAARSAYIRR